MTAVLLHDRGQFHWRELCSSNALAYWLNAITLGERETGCSTNQYNIGQPLPMVHPKHVVAAVSAPSYVPRYSEVRTGPCLADHVTFLQGCRTGAANDLPTVTTMTASQWWPCFVEETFRSSQSRETAVSHRHIFADVVDPRHESPADFQSGQSKIEKGLRYCRGSNRSSIFCYRNTYNLLISAS